MVCVCVVCLYKIYSVCVVYSGVGICVCVCVRMCVVYGGSVCVVCT